jgi:3-hydroxymyristoyl/3-hydroxydecanoyl-(acyl carrier protein) dehydratase
MLEMAGQTAAFFWRYLHHLTAFVAFGGVDDCKFREAVVPPARIYLICQQLEVRPRRIRCRTQAIVSGRLVFEATITGLPLPDSSTASDD